VDYVSLSVIPVENYRAKRMTLDIFPPEHFRRKDETADSLFYGFPRLVVHIDDQAIRTLTNLYGRLLPPQGTYLDLMSSWRSHLPEDHVTRHVMGLGMNPVEMAQNPQLDRYVVHDLNAAPQLPFEAGVFDAVICAVSVQYLIRPIEVFRDVNRVLKPEGVFVVSFSNRCFPNKAIAAWLAATADEHINLVKQYFNEAQHWIGLDTFAHVPEAGDPLYAVWARKLR
jgi:SAM-dependent methyltransferase